VEFIALPQVPLTLVWWDADDEFEARAGSCSARRPHHLYRRVRSPRVVADGDAEGATTGVIPQSLYPLRIQPHQGTYYVEAPADGSGHDHQIWGRNPVLRPALWWTRFDETCSGVYARSTKPSRISMVVPGDLGRPATAQYEIISGTSRIRCGSHRDLTTRQSQRRLLHFVELFGQRWDVRRWARDRPRGAGTKKVRVVSVDSTSRTSTTGKSGDTATGGWVRSSAMRRRTCSGGGHHHHASAFEHRRERNAVLVRGT
jgi:hypothetical protein